MSERKDTITMRIESKEKLAAYFWENPGLKTLELDNCPGLTSLPALPSTLTYLRVDNCPGLTSRGLRVGKLTIEIR